jgi:putative membrane protein
LPGVEIAGAITKGRYRMATAVVSKDVPAATELAVDRTRLAYERTLMAWIRTATSLITFGFTIYKFFQYMIETGQAPARERLIGPRGFGIFMIGIGLLALLLATIGHRRNMQALRRSYGHVDYSLAAVLAAVISVLGLLALIAAIFRQ